MIHWASGDSQTEGQAAALCQDEAPAFFPVLASLLPPASSAAFDLQVLLLLLSLFRSVVARCVLPAEPIQAPGDGHSTPNLLRSMLC